MGWLMCRSQSPWMWLYTSIGKCSLKIGCSDVPINRCSRLGVNREREGAANGGANIHTVDRARTGNTCIEAPNSFPRYETRFVHGDRSREPL